MKVTVYSRDKSERDHGVEIEITEYSSITNCNNLFLVKEISHKFENENNIREFHDFNIEVNSIDFIASCKTSLDKESQVLFAFYRDYTNELNAYLISDSCNNYALYTHSNCRIINYSSYVESCKLLGVKQLEFKDYYTRLTNDSLEIETEFRSVITLDE